MIYGNSANKDGNGNEGGIGRKPAQPNAKTSFYINNIRNKTGWEAPYFKDMQAWVKDFTLVKIVGRKPLEILEHWRVMMEVTLQKDW